MKITVSKDAVYSGNLILVNREFPIRGEGMDDLAAVSPRFPEIKLKSEAQIALQTVLSKIRSGDQIVPVSGYRPREEQVEIYESSLRENGLEFTKQFVALPDHSEHQTGLAIDLALHQEHIDFIRPEFPDEGICGRFRKLAPRYGFAERYPKGKESITGIAWEPWHFRYVGYPHSEILTSTNLTLEEYIACIKHFPGYDRCLPWGKGYEIFYTPVVGEETVIELPEDCRYEVSGNNEDGFIVTVRRKYHGD